MILLIKLLLNSLILFLEIQELFKNSLVLCVCVLFLDVYFCAVCWHGTCGDQKRVLVPLELGLTDGSKPLLVLGIWSGSAVKSNILVFLTAEPFPHPHVLFKSNYYTLMCSEKTGRSIYQHLRYDQPSFQS